MDLLVVFSCLLPLRGVMGSPGCLLVVSESLGTFLVFLCSPGGCAGCPGRNPFPLILNGSPQVQKLISAGFGVSIWGGSAHPGMSRIDGSSY